MAHLTPQNLKHRGNLPLKILDQAASTSAIRAIGTACGFACEFAGLTGSWVMITFNSSTFRSGGPPSLARTLVGALLFCLALGVIVLGAIFGAVLLAVGLVVSTIGAFVMALRRQLTGQGPAQPASEMQHSQPGLQRETGQTPGELRGVVIDVESVTEERD